MSSNRYLLCYTGLSLGLSLFGSLGLVCFIDWYGMAVFGERHCYPYRYPFCIAAGFVSLFICIALLVITILLAVKQPKPKYWLIEIPVVLITFIPMLLLWANAIPFVGKLF